jgi:hypothetical protein
VWDMIGQFEAVAQLEFKLSSSTLGDWPNYVACACSRYD